MYYATIAILNSLSQNELDFITNEIYNSTSNSVKYIDILSEFGGLKDKIDKFIANNDFNLPYNFKSLDAIFNILEREGYLYDLVIYSPNASISEYKLSIDDVLFSTGLEYTPSNLDTDNDAYHVFWKNSEGIIDKIITEEQSKVIDKMILTTSLSTKDYKENDNVQKTSFDIGVIPFPSKAWDNKDKNLYIKKLRLCERHESNGASEIGLVGSTHFGSLNSLYALIDYHWYNTNRNANYKIAEIKKKDIECKKEHDISQRLYYNTKVNTFEIYRVNAITLLNVVEIDWMHIAKSFAWSTQLTNQTAIVYPFGYAAKPLVTPMANAKFNSDWYYSLPQTNTDVAPALHTTAFGVNVMEAIWNSNGKWSNLSKNGQIYFQFQ